MKLPSVVIMATSIPIIMALSGCRSDAVYKEKVAPTASAIQTAEEQGATQAPDAAFYLRKSKEEFDQAKALAGRNKKYEAASLLLRADADAELAAALAQEDAEKKGAAEEMTRVRQLRQDNQLPVSDENGGGTP